MFVSRVAGSPVTGSVVSIQSGARQRGLAGARGLEVVHLGQPQRQLLLGQRRVGAVLAVHDGERLAPVALTREEPVAQLVVDRALTLPLLLEPLSDLALLGLVDLQPVEELGVDGFAGAGVGLLLDVPAGDDLADGQAEGAGELPVALVVRGHGHDRAGAVAGQHVVGDPDGDLLAVDRVDGVGAGEDAGLFLGQVGALELGFWVASST